MRRLLLPLLIIGLAWGVKGESEDSPDKVNLEEVEENNEIPRFKRDVLKGKNQDLVRTKRYIGRVPVAYMKKAILPDDLQPYENDDQDYGQGDERNQNSLPVLTHFREFQNTGFYDPSKPQPITKLRSYGQGSASIPLTPFNPYANRFPPSKPIRDPLDLNSLSDDEIQTLLLLLDGYELTKNANRDKKSTQQKCEETRQAENQSPQIIRSHQQSHSESAAGHRWTPEQIQAIMDMYIRPRMGAGKRETGKRSPQRNYEQPMSFDNAMYSDGDQVEFLTDKGSKRVGTRDLMAKTAASNRFKKETDPAVVAALGRAFAQGRGEQQQQQVDMEKAPIMEAAPPSQQQHKLGSPKPKKDIDWNNYFGIDKRSNENTDQAPQAPAKTDKNVKGESNSNISKGKMELEKQSGSISSPLLKSRAQLPTTSTTGTVGKVKEAKEALQKAEERKENEVHNKEDDRDWILQQFYKNFAMSTNIKRKRESPSANKPSSDLDKLEQLEKKMADAGDQIIWDALKYTGAHRDETLSPEQLAQVKNNIVQKLSTAYSLEKVREAVDDLREQISSLEKRAQH